MKPERNRPVSIEDLLRLKRAERPPAEFWGEFDRKLREKQLAALVAKRPWWQRLPRLSPVLARYRLVLGGTAVALGAFFSLPADRSAAPAVTMAPEAALETVVAAPVAAAGLVGAEPVVEERMPIAPAPEIVATTTPVVDQRADVVVADASLAEPAMPENISRLVALGGGSVAAVEKAVASSSARHISASLAAVELPEPVVVGRLLGGANGFEARAMPTPTRTTIDPLQQMTPPGESRRSRLLTAMVSSAALETSVRTTERAANRFAEEGVYDQSQRFGARGDRVHVKF